MWGNGQCRLEQVIRQTEWVDLNNNNNTEPFIIPHREAIVDWNSKSDIVKPVSGYQNLNPSRTSMRAFYRTPCFPFGGVKRDHS